jgi:hypothetical protein
MRHYAFSQHHRRNWAIPLKSAISKMCSFEQTAVHDSSENLRRSGGSNVLLHKKCMMLMKVTINNLRQPAEPKPEIVERAIVELLEIAQRHSITPADFMQLLDSGMHISEFLAAMTTYYCWVCGHEVSLETCKVDEHGSAVHEACLFARMKMETASSHFGASQGLPSET